MKTRNFSGLLTIAAVTVTCLLTRDVMAQGSSDVATIPNVAPTAAPAGGAPVPLSYGVSQIIQLSKAKVSDDTIVNYIRNSGNSYGMDASQIVYLKQQGISDTVINTMLNQPRLTQTAVPTAPQPAYPAASSTATYVQTAPAYVPSSTVYVIPDTQTYQYYNNYYPACGYYPYYGGWYYPPVSFSFGFGGGYRGGYYHGGWGGGYRGGYHGGGGWHR